MTLRARLTLFFVGIVVIPLLVAGFVLRALVGGEVERRTNTRLENGARAVAALWSDRVATAEHQVAAAARSLRAGGDAAELEALRARGGLDFLVLARPGGVGAASVAGSRFSPGVDEPSPEQLSGDLPLPGVLRARVGVRSEGPEAALVGGWFTDADLAEEFAEVTGMDVIIVQEGAVLASTGPETVAIPSEPGTFEVEGKRRGLLVPMEGSAGGIALVAPEEPRVGSSALWVVAAAALALAVVLGWALAGAMVRPLDRLAAGARAVAAGDLNARVDPVGQGDVAHLADAFNAMTTNLRSYVDELKSSRDELRRALGRLGAALRSTHDLHGMVGVVLETAAATLRAEAGAVFLLAPDGETLRLEVARGYRPPEGAILPVGHGVAGRAAAGVTVRVPGATPIDSASPVEPRVHTAIAVPLTPRDRPIGVLAVYGCSVPEAFNDEDARTLQSLAAQAAVGIENVLLHQEAQRLSATDSLTGVANRRSLGSTLVREIERAQRFDRPLSVLMLDLDRFKRVNDVHGHRRGDEVLVEVARRIQSQIRGSIDTLARYGGEEFVIVLPETAGEGALVVAEKIRESVRATPFASTSGPEIRMTVSIGTATFPDDGTTVDDLLRAADDAMYRAKEQGRDRVFTSAAG